MGSPVWLAFDHGISRQGVFAAEGEEHSTLTRALRVACIWGVAGALLGCAWPRASSGPSRPPVRHVVYLDQRAGNGFLPPRHAPRLRKQLPFRPTIIGVLRIHPPSLGGQFLVPSAGPPQQNPALDPWLQWAVGALTGAATGPGGWPAFPTAAALPQPPPRIQPSQRRPGCGFALVGGEAIPLDCNVPGYGDVRNAARPLVPYYMLRASSLHAGAAELPLRVDHREEGSESAVRHQGSVGSCSGFSFSGAVDHAVAQSSGNPGFVSTMHIWSRYHQPSMSLPAEKNLKRPLTREELWPYTKDNQRLACSWVPKKDCRPTCNASGGSCACRELNESECERPVDPRSAAEADAQPYYVVTAVTTVHSYQDRFDKQALLDVLAKGQDLWMSMAFTYDAFDNDKLLKDHDGLPAVVPDFSENDATSAHAMVIVGYAIQAQGTYFLLRNSWGDTWGDHGYAWIHEKTLEKNLHSAYVVQAELTDPNQSPLPPRDPRPTQCPPELLPDSISGQCVPPCSDGSARQNGVCADPVDCPPGYVNLTGQCVVAAPTQRGTDPSTGISFLCGPGGCTYYVPFGPYCALPWCAVSCPAPRFSLAATPGELSCSE